MNKRQPFRCYWDACVFISLIEGDGERLPTIEAILAEVHKNGVEVFTSILSIVEASFAKAEKDGKALDAEVEQKIEKLWNPGSPFKLVEMYSSLMVEAKSLMRALWGRDGHSLKPADAIHFVTARKVGVHEFHTYDEKLWRFSDEFDFSINKPRTDNFVFPDD